MQKFINLAFLLFGLVALNQAYPHNGPSAADSAYKAYLSGSLKPTYTVNPTVPVTTRTQYVNLNTEFANARYVPTAGSSHSSLASYEAKPAADVYTPVDVSETYSGASVYSSPAYSPPAYVPPTFSGPKPHEKVHIAPISVSVSEIPGDITYKHYAAQPDFRRVALPLAYDSPIAKLHVPISEPAYEHGSAYKSAY